jgi:hypothetical protein
LDSLKFFGFKLRNLSSHPILSLSVSCLAGCQRSICDGNWLTIAIAARCLTVATIEPEDKMRWERESGLGMVEAIIASMVGIIGLVALNAGIVNVKKASRKVESELDVSGIRANLSQSISCLTKGNPCPTGRYVDLKTSLEKVVIGSGGTRIGHWVVRAYCQPPSSPGATDGGLDIRALGVLPAHDTTAEARTWHPQPTNLDYFRKDELTQLPYDSDHPRARVSTPGATSLCSDWFGTVTPTGNCSGPNQFVKSIDFDNQTVACGSVPNCTGNNVLNFDGVNFSCSSAFSSGFSSWITNISTTLNNSIATVVNTNNTHVTNLTNSINYVNSRFDTLGLGPFAEVLGTNNYECQSLSRMKCPDGYLMWAYEARIVAGHNCRVQCRKIIP